MVLPLMSTSEPNPSEAQSDFLNFFSQAIERYKQSVIASGGEDERATSRNVPPKKRSSSYSAEHEAYPEKPSKMSKLSAAAGSMEPTDSSTDEQNDPNNYESDGDIEKKRLASRVSSRRTREREKLRMDHFRNAKLKLQQENKKLQDENNEIRSLIQKIKDEKTFLDRKAAVVQSMMATNNPTHSQPSFPLQATQGLPTPAMPMPPQQPQVSPLQSQQALAALLLNALVQPPAGNNIPPVASLPPPQPPQDQQLLSLLGLMSTNPALAQLLAVNAAQPQPQPPQPQPQPILSAALLGGFGSALGANQVLGNNNNNSLQQNLLSLLLAGGAGGQQGAQNAAAAHLGFLSVDNNSRSM